MRLPSRHINLVDFGPELSYNPCHIIGVEVQNGQIGEGMGGCAVCTRKVLKIHLHAVGQGEDKFAYELLVNR